MVHDEAVSPSRLVVLAGPSGVGKGTIVRELLRRHPEVWLSVSATTREPRPGELDGVHYHFVSHAEFRRMREEGDLLEWAEVFGMNFYGTPRLPVQEHLEEGRPVLLEVDLDGARQVRRTAPDALQVFVLPPSFEELQRRLEGRGTETPESQRRRLATARVELAAAEEFDVVIVNDDLVSAVTRLEQVMGLAGR